MKKYFQKIYNETGKKPFTFLNCMLAVLLPIAIFIFSGVKLMDTNPNLGVTVMIGGTIVCWLINIIIWFVNYKNIGRVLALFFLTMLASIAFFCKLILFPFIGLLFKIGSASTDIQTGNYAGASNTMNSGGKVRTSAFSWFQYDGTVIDDVEVEAQTDRVSNAQAWSSTLNRSYTAEEDTRARQLGFADAKDAEMSGRINDVIGK